MKSTEHFLRILQARPESQAKGSAFSITIEELASVLSCTARNVKLILRRLEEEGAIEWRAGIGRGNPSRLTLLRDLDEVTEEQFRELLDKGKIEEAMDLLYRKELPIPLRDKLRGLLDERFGFLVERKDAATLDVLRIALNRMSLSLDPAFVSTASEAYFLKQICDTLVTFDPAKKIFLPALAHAWESDEEGRSWTFYLRRGVRFHHGRALIAKDVLHTLQRLNDVHSPSRWQYEEIERAEAVSDHVVTFRLRRPNPFFLHFFGCFYMSVLPYDVEFSEKAMIGTGPFRMAEFTGRVLVLEAFEDYYRERALLDRIELWYIPSEGFSSDRYQLPHLEEERLEEDGRNGEFESPMTGCQFLVFNFRKKGVHLHRSFRKAMRLVFDRLAMIGDLREHRFAPADSFLPDISKLARFEETSLEEAKAFLLESGYAGETVKLYYWDNGSTGFDAEWLQRRCAVIGLQVSLHAIPVSAPETDREADMIIICEALEDDIEWGYLRLFLDESTCLHRLFGRKQHAWLDERLREWMRLPLPEQREKIIEEIEGKIRDEDWLLFGYHMNRISRFHPAISGVSLDSFGWIDFSKLWIKPV